MYSEGCPAGAVALSRGMQPIHSDLTGKETGNKEPDSLLFLSPTFIPIGQIQSPRTGSRFMPFL